MSPVNPSSFGRRTGAVRRYPGGTQNVSIFLTLSRETPKWRAAARSLIPSRHARRTLRYSSIRFAARRLACESSRPPHDQKGLPDWQSFAPPQRDHPAATVVYFCTGVCSRYVANSCAHCDALIGRFYEYTAWHEDNRSAGELTWPLDDATREVLAYTTQRWAVWDPAPANARG